MQSGMGFWARDPNGQHEFRFWDGAKWTEHVSDGGIVSTAEIASPTAAPTPLLAPPPPPPPGVASAAVFVTSPRNSGLAIASMVLGILGFYAITAVLAVIFGHVSLRQIQKAGGSIKGRGMAIAGLVLGYIGIVGWTILIVIIATVGIDTHDRASCETQRMALEAAEATHIAVNGSFATERELVEQNYLRRDVPGHRVLPSSAAPSYVVISVGDCRY